MKRLLTVLLAVILLLSLCIPVSVAETGTNDSLSETEMMTDKATARTVKLKRGKTLELWVYPFASTTQFYKDCGKEYPVKGIVFSGTVGKVKAKVTSGGSWLKAKKTSSGWSFYVTGKNLTGKDKYGVIRITDEEGAFAVIEVIRGGVIKYSRIYSKGSSIYAELDPSSTHINSDLYVYRWIFDKNGKLVGKKKFELKTTLFRETIKSTHLYYTYVYTIGYYPEATGMGMQTAAAAIYLSNPYSNIGKVKTATSPKNCVSASWLYGIVH